ncbi:hypothetical protein [Lutibacter sp.]
MKKINNCMLTELNKNELLNINGGVQGGSLLSGSLWFAAESAANTSRYIIGFIKGWTTAWLE